MNNWYNGIENGKARNDIDDSPPETSAQRKKREKLRVTLGKIAGYSRTDPTKRFSYKKCPYSPTERISCRDAHANVSNMISRVNRQGHVCYGGRIWVR